MQDWGTAVRRQQVSVICVSNCFLIFTLHVTDCGAGLGRLAACFLDSMATLDLPAWGYGIRYNYGIFRQEIRGGYQFEVPDSWLTRGNPWEIERVDVTYPVRLYGHVAVTVDAAGKERCSWEGGEVVIAMAYDNPIPGFDTYNTINLRLWRAVPSREFDLASFNSGDYIRAVDDRQRAESISAVLYPSDATLGGKELRLKQQYFFVSATLRDVIRRFKKKPDHKWSEFPLKVMICCVLPSERCVVHTFRWFSCG
jgi:starch phosphorylase